KLPRDGAPDKCHQTAQDCSEQKRFDHEILQEFCRLRKGWRSLILNAMPVQVSFAFSSQKGFLDDRAGCTLALSGHSQRRWQMSDANSKNVKDTGVTRRDFLGLAVAATCAAGAEKLAWAADTKEGMTYRTLGRTSEKVSMVGLGGYHIGMQKDEQ